MKIAFVSLLLFLGALTTSQGEEFNPNVVIHPVVAKLGAPQSIPGFEEGVMGISSSSPGAAGHVAQGMTKLNTAWDFEAYRHFCAAVKEDPDCLMAYWGVIMSLAGSQHEFYGQRQAAVDRMLDLLEADAAGDGNRWTRLEKGYAQAAGLLLTSGVRAAGEAFRAISQEFPGDLQARLFSHYLLRDGFDSSGAPLVGQQRAIEGLKAALGEHPESLAAMAFWVNCQSEAPLKTSELLSDVLPVARRLTERFPNYPPFRLMRTHVEARCGRAALGMVEAMKACQLYQAYMDREKVTLHDCEGWVRAKVYFASLAEVKGEGARAEAAAAELAAIQIDEARVFSRGAGLLLWEGRTVGARIMMGRSDTESFQRGEALLSKQKDAQWFKEKSYALYYRDCLGFYLAVRKAIAARNLKAAQSLFDAFSTRVQTLGDKRALAQKTSSYASWLRAMNGLAMMLPELRGLLAEMEEGATRLTAGTWYRAAADRQGRPANLLPNIVDYPMEWRLANFYAGQGLHERAIEFSKDALRLRPNHLGALKTYYRALVSAGQKKAAAEIEGEIKAVEKKVSLN